MVTASRKLVVEEFLGVQCRHAAEPGARHRLTVDLVRDISGGEYTGDTRLCSHAVEPGIDHDLAVLHVQLAFEDVRVWHMPDGDKDAFYGQVDRLFACDGAYSGTCYPHVVS